MLGIELYKNYGMTMKRVYRSVMHPYRGREWYPLDNRELARYTKGYMPPNYPVPTKIGEVLSYYNPNTDDMDIIIEDVDPRFDPQCCFYVWLLNNGEVRVETDQPNTSPNYR